MPRARGTIRHPAHGRGGAERQASATRRSAPERGRASPLVPWTWLALVALAAVAVYANSLGGALLFDDVNAIRNNPFVRGAAVTAANTANSSTLTSACSPTFTTW